MAVIAKAPVSGMVKTRLCPPCTPEEAALFAEAFLLDAVATVTAVGSADLWCAHLGDAGPLRALFPGAAQLIEQRGSNFAERLANITTDLLALSYDRVVLLAADCPTVDVTYLSAALDGLDDYDITIGPADDGGYVLIGLRSPNDSLFVGIEMGTERVFTETLQRTHAAGLQTLTLPVLHDIDTADDLLGAIAAGELSHARHTMAMLHSARWARGAALTHTPSSNRISSHRVGA